MNSLTANNRLSQQLVVSVAEHLLLRHECRLPNHLAVSNHRELYLTVGGELCRNLTAGFVTEEDFMFMLFVGSQKHSALSIFAKTTRMSALVLCGNSGVILLSVKDHQHIDSGIPGRYTVQAPYKAGAGISTPELSTAIYDAPASFLSSTLTHARIMVGWAGEPKGSPVSVDAGSANPVQSATSEISTSGGGSFPQSTEAAIMATIPALTQPEITIINGQAVTSSLAVAYYFSKRHDDVLKKIRFLDCSPEFCARNFAETSISLNQPNGGTRKLPCYQITRDGFAFLAMGFTGKRAAQFKEAYINAFNQMEKQLSNPSVLSDVAHNASVLYSYISSIHQVWLQQLYPMLAKAESPLAVSLYDYINDASALACLINLSLNPSEVRGRK
ncbi:TPA: Rha family transcriptional regulator [Escherichia coli]|nr:peptidase [Escherichia coli]HCN3974345.1 Rha family transcriptional regulator [Escherichia coli]HDD9320282.1 Rha family transcriptional regulator [Escherichia coli]